MENNNFIQLLLSKVTLSVLISPYTDLHKTGSSFKGKCPFHQEKTASFNVNDEKGLYHCFGCGESGNAIHFISKMEHLSFKDALEKLAQQYNMPLDKKYEKKMSAQQILGKKLIQLNQFMMQEWKIALQFASNKTAANYLKNRGISESTIEKFDIGYAPFSAFFISQKIATKTDIFTQEVLLKSSLFYENKFRSIEQPYIYKDRFTHKLIFPIKNAKQEVIAFGSRVLDDSLPKYINSNETVLFQKKRVLYGLEIAKKDILLQQKAFVVEGYFDVLAMHDQGFSNTVATLGTSITEHHIEILKPLVQSIVFMFDGDTAGQKAATKAVFLSLQKECFPEVVLFPDQMDPCDYLTKYGGVQLQEYLQKNTYSWKQFCIYLVQQEGSHFVNRQKRIESIVKVLSPLDPFLLKEFFQDLSEVFQIPFDDLKQYHQLKSNSQASFSNHFPTYTKEDEKENIIYEKRKMPSKFEASVTISTKNNALKEFYLLSLLCFYPELYDKYFHRISPEFFTQKDAKKIFQYFLLFQKENPQGDKNLFKESLSPELQKHLIYYEIRQESYNSIQKSFQDALWALKISYLEKNIISLKKEIQKAEEMNQHDLIIELMAILKRYTIILQDLKQKRTHQ